MNRTRKLHDLGQSLWLDNITREILDNGTLRRYIDEFSITGLTSNPTIFDQAIGATGVYDDDIRRKAKSGQSGEALFVELALEDLRRAADLFRPVFDTTDGLDGWVSMEVSPLLAEDAAGSIHAATQIHAQASRQNLFVKIPGTPEGIPAIEELIFAGVPINVTLLFSREHYLAAAEAYMRGIERRISAGLDARVGSVASIFISRWDKAVSGIRPEELRKQVQTERARSGYRDERSAGIDPQIASVTSMFIERGDEATSDALPPELRNRLGIAIGQRTYSAYRDVLGSKRWQKLAAVGARPQRLLWASTGTKDAHASDTLYVEALAAPDTINTMPEKTLLAYADHGQLAQAMARDGGDAETVLTRFAQAGIDVDALALRLQHEGAQSFVKSWQELMRRIGDKSAALAGPRKREQSA